MVLPAVTGQPIEAADINAKISTTDANAAYATKAEAGMVPLAQLAPASGTASIILSAIPAGYENLRLVLLSRGSATSNVILRFNGDTGANYDDQRVQGTTTVASAVSQPAAAGITIGAHPSLTTQAAMMDMIIPGYARTGIMKPLFSSGARFDDLGGGSNYAYATAGNWRNAAAITSLTLFPATGTFSAGTVATLYGMKGI